MRANNIILMSDLLSLEDNFYRYNQFADDKYRKFLIGLCLEVSPLVELGVLKKLIPRDIPQQESWLFKQSKLYRLACLLKTTILLLDSLERYPQNHTQKFNPYLIALKLKLLHPSCFTSLKC